MNLTKAKVPLGVLLLVLLAATMVIVFAQFWPLGPDYGIFIEEASAFFAGNSLLYQSDSLQYFLMPWSVILIYPLTFLPYNYGQAILTVFTLTSLIFTTWVIGHDEFISKKKFLLFLLIALSTLHTFDLIERGNLDGFPVLGLGLAWLGLKKGNWVLLAAGYWFLSLKPINIIIPGALILLMAMRWPIRKQIFAIIPLFISFTISFPIFGRDWVIRYLIFSQMVPPFEYLQTSLWRAFEYFNLPRIAAIALFPLAAIIAVFIFLKSRHFSAMSLAAAIATQLFFSPYSLGSHYTLLAPAVIVIAARQPKLLFIWVLTLTPLLRLFFGFSISWIDNIYPFAVMLAAWYFYAKDHKLTTSPNVEIRNT